MRLSSEPDAVDSLESVVLNAPEVYFRHPNGMVREGKRDFERRASNLGLRTPHAGRKLQSCIRAAAKREVASQTAELLCSTDRIRSQERPEPD